METAAPDPTDVLYCIAVCFDDLLCITGDAPGTATGVGPYAYCVVSRHPFVEAFGALLLRLHAGEALSLRPRPSSAALGLGIFGAAQPGPCPAWADAQARRRCDTLAAWAGPPLFERLGVDALLRVLAALLLEMRVLVVARRVPDGSAAVFGLGSLLWPLSWQHLLLPICPLALQDAIIDAPVPFLCALRE
ncbi:unnamed protein product, partial [Prorocentrum cordatum]